MKVLMMAAMALLFGSVATPLTPVLERYYDLKDALVQGDAALASQKGGQLLEAVNAVDLSRLSDEERKAFAPIQAKLAYDARHISEVQDIDHQREHFAHLSMNLSTLAKAVKISGSPVYQVYCPMKKAYWLSPSKVISNPYLGTEMPTCGNITATW